MDKADVYAEYRVSEGGAIRNPGKFEGESWIAPIVYEWVMGGGGELVTDCSCEDDAEYCECPSSDVFTLDDNDRIELETAAFAVSLFVSDQGFVYVSELDEAEYNKLVF